MMEMNNFSKVLEDALNASEKLINESQNIINKHMPKDEDMTPEIRAEIKKQQDKIKDIENELKNYKQ